MQSKNIPLEEQKKFLEGLMKEEEIGEVFQRIQNDQLSGDKIAENANDS